MAANFAPMPLTSAVTPLGQIVFDELVQFRVIRKEERIRRMLCFFDHCKIRNKEIKILIDDVRREFAFSPVKTPISFKFIGEYFRNGDGVPEDVEASIFGLYRDLKFRPGKIKDLWFCSEKIRTIFGSKVNQLLQPTWGDCPREFSRRLCDCYVDNDYKPTVFMAPQSSSAMHWATTFVRVGEGEHVSFEHWVTTEEMLRHQLVPIPPNSLVGQPIAEPFAEPFAEPIAEPVAEPIDEPIAQPVAEPTAEPVAEPVFNSYDQTIAEVISQNTAWPSAPEPSSAPPPAIPGVPRRTRRLSRSTRSAALKEAFAFCVENDLPFNLEDFREGSTDPEDDFDDSD